MVPPSPDRARRWRSSGVLAACSFVCAGFVAFQVYDAACSQAVLAERTRHAYTRAAAVAVARALESEAARRPLAAPASAERVAALLPGALARHPPLLPGDLRTPQRLPAESLVAVAIVDGRGRAAAPGGAPDEARAARVALDGALAGHVAVVALRPRAARAIARGMWSWNRAQLAIALVTVTATLVVGTLLQLRRERALARLRSDFVSGVSHELRTPLAQIRMFAEVLQLGWVRSEEERARAVAVIDQEARRLTGLVENVLQFSRAERGTARVAVAPVALAEFVAEVVASFALLAGTRGVRLRADGIAPGLTVTADRGALRQALLNLLDNALKYGPRGQTVRVGAERAGAGRVQLWVADEGPGVPVADRGRVWEAFERLERDVDAGIAGNGIGLSVVRELARAQGGRAFVADAPDRRPNGAPGARFVVELPAADAPPTSGAAGAPRPARRRRVTAA